MGFNSGFKGLKKTEYSRKILEEYSNIEFQENPCSESRIVQCGLTNG